MKYKISILGASGYTGVELIRLLLTHKNAEIVSLGAETSAGKDITEIYPHLAFYKLPKLQKIEEIDYNNADVIFLCLPHGTTQEIALKLPKNKLIIDLSADFRLENPVDYKTWYEHEHKAMGIQKNAVYALTEIKRKEITKDKFIANPGCYPTSILLPLIPLLEKNLIEKTGIIADSKSGISGAGRKANQANLLSELANNFKPYGIAGHRHIAEIEQELSLAAKSKMQITFTPQVIPVSRGILSCIYVQNALGVTTEELKNTLVEKYKNENFVYIAKSNTVPTIADVATTNNCYINIFADRISGRSIIISTIDNLVKGASGQAVQNMNVALGLDETLGLKHSAIFP
ncbi:MAG TPA: N-acetyl-gamma-glutamyl-phosphate reductase [Alphaproteobacteria bacterium]|nr:N-acetyl-gamma-glutamyl-phosphate reductase [Alphaproteobacteria bacterium]